MEKWEWVLHLFSGSVFIFASENCGPTHFTSIRKKVHAGWLLSALWFALVDRGSGVWLLHLHVDQFHMLQAVSTKPHLTGANAPIIAFKCAAVRYPVPSYVLCIRGPSEHKFPFLIGNVRANGPWQAQSFGLGSPKQPLPPPVLLTEGLVFHFSLSVLGNVFQWLNLRWHISFPSCTLTKIVIDHLTPFP